MADTLNKVLLNRRRNVVAQRARQIASEAEALNEELPEKPVTMAIKEVAAGELTAGLKEEYQK